MNSSKLLLKGAFWVALTRVFVGLIGFASTVTLARLLVPEDFGLVAIAASIATVFVMISELTMAEALIQCDEPTDDHFHTAWTLNLIRGSVLALLLVGLAWPMSLLYGEPRLFEIMLAFAAANFIGSLISPKLAMFERKLEFRQWVILNGAEKLAGFVAAAAIAFAYHSYWALVVGILASQLTKVTASYILAHYLPKFSLSQIKSLLSFSVWLTLNRGVNALNGRADPLLLGAFISTASLGHFSMGSRVSTLAVGETLQPITQVLFPGLARIKHERERLKAAYLRAQGVFCLIVLPVGAGLAVVADPLVPLVLGEKWQPAAYVIQILAITAALSRMIPLGAIAMALGETRAMFLRSLLNLSIRVPLVFAGLMLGPQFQTGALTGALWGHALGTSVIVFINISFVSRVTGLPITDQLQRIWRPVVATLAMAMAVLSFFSVASGADDSAARIVNLVVAVGLGATIYSLTLLLAWYSAGRPLGAETEVISLTAKMLRKLGPFSRANP